MLLTHMPQQAKRTLVLCGGGSGTHVLVADVARRDGWEVRIVTTKPEHWGVDVSCTETVRKQRWSSFGTRQIQYQARPHKVFSWDNVADAVQGADMIFLVCPVHMHRTFLQRVFAVLPPRSRCIIGSLYAQGGIDWTIRDLLQQYQGLDKLTFFGFKRFPFTARIQEYGRKVALLYRHPKTTVAIHGPNEALAKSLLYEIFGKKIVHLPSFLSCTLNLSNQLFHPPITLRLFEDYEPGQTFYDNHLAFYKACDREATRYMEHSFQSLVLLLQQMELQTGHKLRWFLGADPGLSLVVKPRIFFKYFMGFLRLGPLENLSCYLLSALFRNNKVLGDIKAPMKQDPQGRGFVPDITSRFWQDDIPHGLCVIYGLTKLVGIEATSIKTMIKRHQRLMGKCYIDETGWGPDMKETNAPQRYNISSRQELNELLVW